MPIQSQPHRLHIREGGGRVTRIWSHFPNVALAALRIVAGLMFVQHGVQKLFGWLTPSDQPFRGAPALLSQMWVAGTLETFGGMLIAFGFLTRPVAFLLSGEMAVAYFMVHAPQGLFPILNRGELAALYCFVFLVFWAVGGGPYSVDGMLRHRRERVLAERGRVLAEGQPEREEVNR